MAKIRKLDPRTADQIAAGEVVERPASVVKELIENALDAGSASIRVEIARGGLEEIRVLDDGDGMESEDLELAVQRHATSKLSRIEDLGDLKTLGFRGEALPSIASVSRLLLESCPDESGRGKRVRVDGGERSPLEEVGHPRGTTVVVRDLFYNTPARRKFMKSETTEQEQILDVVSRAALAHFDRRLALASSGRTILDLPPARSRAERVRQLFGEGVAAQLVPFARHAGALSAAGFASKPELHRSAARDVRLFVCGRPVRDRGLMSAVLQAYATLLPRGRYPFVLVFLDLPPERVDFNVHPAKWEVRFADAGGMFELVRGAIRAALQNERPMVPLAGLEAPTASIPPAAGSSAAYSELVGETPAAWTFSPVPLAQDTGAEVPLPEAAARGERLRPLAQYRDSYILASDSEGLVIVDQHAAHERILYERLLREARDRQVPRQALLFPVPLDLGLERSEKLHSGKARLEELGFVLEPFGENSWLLREVPAILSDVDLPSLVADLADDLGASGTGSFEARMDRLAATAACHAAVKVNHPLTSEKMAYILDALGEAASPMTCPHGRPVVLRIRHDALEKNFLRR
ncbi:MAG TPA: DNA mismatch repair endonuclease MutL [Candidatus Polarisedimenticolia bacterium]|nr:DNA mismatch repair endonuclease MutL [Candidatus Polarisedimenticolia bacterium]